MMNYLFYILAAVFFVVWFVGFMVMNMGSAIHAVFVAGVICLIIQTLRENKE
ncbi:lmo0937 family membrane protein [Weeksellaceae bacterium A-14]|uniref:lmo0937 family membrane protein n=1 Tax=Daejeonia sp. YH14 TaxID=3439042 RepID=UPI0031E4A2B0